MHAKINRKSDIFGLFVGRTFPTAGQEVRTPWVRLKVGTCEFIPVPLMYSDLRPRITDPDSDHLKGTQTKCPRKCYRGTEKSPRPRLSMHFCSPSLHVTHSLLGLNFLLRV